MSDIPDDADDLTPERSPIPAVKRDSLADRILVRPIFARQRLVDDHHRRRVATVAVCENAPTLNLNLEGVEIIASDNARPGAELLAGISRRASFNAEADSFIPFAQRQRVDRPN